MDCSLPGSSVHGISLARMLEGLPFPSPGDLLSSGIKPRSPALSGIFFTTELPGMPKRQWNFAYLWLTIPPKLGTLQDLGPCLLWFVSPWPNIVLNVCIGSQSISFPQMALLQIRGHWLDLKHFHRSAILSLKFESTSPTITQQSDSDHPEHSCTTITKQKRPWGSQNRNINPKYKNSGTWT